MIITNLYKKYEYIWLSLIVVLTWGFVPLFAKVGDLAGGQTTMWVNWFGVVGVIAIMAVIGELGNIKKGLPYFTFVKIGLVWPLAYSLAYFNAIKFGGPSLATIANYTWPAFAMLFSYSMLKSKKTGRDWAVVLLAILGVSIPVLLEGNLKILLLPLTLGIFAAIAQAYFNVRTSSFPNNWAWVLTFVVQLVTAIGATIYAMLFESITIPSLTTLGYLAFLGVVSGSVGFWAFIKAGQVAHNLGDKEEITFYILMCLTPLAQVFALLIPFWHVESVSPLRWIGVMLVSSCFLIYKILTREKNK
ncbi:MAG: DMT family transporter [Candidatus Woesebacteria bacterium]|nr:MAG: DMT family transporter [Candidatus Woesebacteria bacterium]